MKNMGRRSKASKLQVNGNMHPRENPIDEESQPVMANHSPKGKNSRPTKTPLKKTITKQKNVRRSQRIQNTSISAQSKKQHAPEEIVLSDIEEQEEEEPEPAQNDQTMEEQDGDDPSGHDGEKIPEPDQNVLAMEEQDGDDPSGHGGEKLPEPTHNDLTVEEQAVEDLSVDEVEKLSRLVENKRTILEKVDYLIELVEGQDKIMEELRAKASESTCQVTKKRISSPTAKYRSMYFESQNKIEELTNENREMALKLENALGKDEVIEELKNENRQMALKLENALGKIEVYEKGRDIHSEVLEKVKDFLLVTNLSKLTETACRGGASPENEPEEPRIANGKKKRKSGASP